MSEFSQILDEMRNKLSEYSAMYHGGELSRAVFEILVGHVTDLMLYRMICLKHTQAPRGVERLPIHGIES
jgi:hypothetical protein